MSCDPASNYGWALVLCLAKALALRMQATVLPACMRNLNAQFSLARPCTAKLDSQIHAFLTSIPPYFSISLPPKTVLTGGWQLHSFKLR